MNMNKVVAEWFANSIALAKAQGMTHYARSCGSMRICFGTTLEEAVRKAKKDARRLARESGCPTMPPSVQSGELA
jgi:hypothetical protein